MIENRNIRAEELVFAQSPKGRDMLLNRGHKYVLINTDRRGVKRWRCNSAIKFGCRAEAKTIGLTFEAFHTHNHPRETFPVKVIKVKNSAQ